MSAPSRPPGSPKPLLMSDWQDAERNAAEWTRYLGFKDARVTPAGPDGGIDIVASGALGQVKAYTRGAIPSPVLQQLYGAAAGRTGQLLFFTTAKSFSPQAIAHADKVGMALYLMKLDGLISPVGRHAGELLKLAIAAHTAPPPRPTPPTPAPVPLSAWDLDDSTEWKPYRASGAWRPGTERYLQSGPGDPPKKARSARKREPMPKYARSSSPFISRGELGEVTFGRLVFRAVALLVLAVFCASMAERAVTRHDGSDADGIGETVFAYFLAAGTAAWCLYLAIKLARLTRKWWRTV